MKDKTENNESKATEGAALRGFYEFVNNFDTPIFIGLEMPASFWLNLLSSAATDITSPFAAKGQKSVLCIVQALLNDMEGNEGKASKLGEDLEMFKNTIEIIAATAYDSSKKL